MLQRILSGVVTRIETFLGVPLPHLRLMIREAPGALVPTFLLMPIGAYGKRVPADVLHMARIGGARAQDCGECLQIAVNMALRDGLPAAKVEAAIGSGDGLSPHQLQALEFGTRVGAGTDDPEGRQAIREAWGERGVIELAMAVAGAVVFPVMKRGMGMAVSCSVAGPVVRTAATRHDARESAGAAV